MGGRPRGEEGRGTTSGHIGTGRRLNISNWTVVKPAQLIEGYLLIYPPGEESDVASCLLEARLRIREVTLRTHHTIATLPTGMRWAV